MGLGIKWTGSATTPAQFATNGNGVWGVAQVITSTQLTVDGTDINPAGTNGLDGFFPYRDHSWAADGNDHSDGDAPDVYLATHTSAIFNASFDDVMMFYPPAVGNNPVSWVPLYKFDWAFSGRADYFITWGLTYGSGVTITNLAPTTTCPSWSGLVVGSPQR